MTDILARYKEVVSKYIKAAVEQIKQQWSSYPADMGNATLSVLERDVTQNIVAFVLSAIGQKMWILEYGKGEEMADSSINPFLEDYLASGYFNKARSSQNMMILGRKRGFYFDLDDKAHITNGHLEGVPLQTVNLKRFIDGEIGKPMKPKFIIRNILFGTNGKGIISEMEKELQMVSLQIITDTYKLFPQRIVMMK